MFAARYFANVYYGPHYWDKGSGNTVPQVQPAGSYEGRARKKRLQREKIYQEIQALQEQEEIQAAPKKKRKAKTYDIALPAVVLVPEEYDETEDLLLLMVSIH